MYSPDDCCYKARPCSADHEDARLVVSIVDYQAAYKRIASLEAERNKAVEFLREIVPSSKCDLCYPSYCWPHGEKAPCPIGEAQAFLALVGGEVKNG